MEKQIYPNLRETLFRTTLPNGLRILVLPKPGFTKQLAYFVTDFGALHREFTLNGTPCQVPAGVAHYLEHKLFDMPQKDVMEEFATLGASVNAFTSYDLTAYYFSCTKNFPQCLKLLLSFVSTGYFTQESVDKEQGIIGQEIGMNQDSPDSRVFEELMKAMYPIHPINTPILGSCEDIAQITPEILQLCHKAFYRPKNMVLCVVGDVDPEAVAAMAQEILPAEDLEQVEVVRSWQEKMSVSKAETTCKMAVSMPMFQLGFKAEPPQKGIDGIYQEIVGDLAAEALFGESSQLYLELYNKGLIDNSFGGGFETVEDLALLTAGGDSGDPEAVKNAIFDQIQRLLQEGISQEDFLRMKRSALGRRIRDLDSFDTTAFRLCAYLFDDFDYFRFPEIYEAVQREDVLNFLSRVVSLNRCSLSVIYPTKEET